MIIKFIQSNNCRVKVKEFLGYGDSNDLGECRKIAYYFKGKPIQDCEDTFVFPDLNDIATTEAEYKAQGFFYIDDEIVYDSVHSSEEYLHEYPVALTDLPKVYFLGCCLLAVINLCGVHSAKLGEFLPNWSMELLKVYSYLFILVPSLRGCWLWLENGRRESRNALKRELISK